MAVPNRYFDLIDQTFYFPQEGFDLDDGYLVFNGVPLMHLIQKYGTPIKLTYLPKIGLQIKKARNLFTRAMKSSGYRGNYHYCYCTKSSHFSYILSEVLEHDVELETSSAFDIELIRKLHQKKKLDKDIIIVCNGFKTEKYLEGIVSLINDGFENVIPVCDNTHEIEYYEKHVTGVCKIGIRVATEEEPNFEFYTSRLGIRNAEVQNFFREKIKDNPKFKLSMLHFFVDTGIKDTLYYWGELRKAIKLYCELKKQSPDLHAINIGGGMPIRNSLGFEFDYKYMVKEIVNLILNNCEDEDVPEPDIFTEFGKYTVGESGATIFSVLASKQQNDAEIWYMIDNSLMTTLPDTWGMGERFILLPINKWRNEYQRVNIGGLSCDNSDYYNSEVHESQVYLPVTKPSEPEPLYLGFFHTGAYQDAISGYGGIKHCLIPSPKHVIVYKNKQGNLVDKLYQEEQSAESMLKVLGY
ncbi:MAG TPA: arginine decarboxylase [Saprospiraceae bacterium]|nr:arginine decarboxylase [Saprospiraceae bacterium]HMQ83277.1 arginine decarboxylase [Saprospiraceae bacterium]